MTETLMTFKDALSADLRAVQLDRRQLADKLGITVQAIAKWVAKGEVPDDRRDDVAAVLGKDATSLQYRAELVPQVKAVPAQQPMRFDLPPGDLARERQRLARFQRSLPTSEPEIELRKLLAAPLLKNLDQAVRFGIGGRRLDYASDKLVLEYKIALLFSNKVVTYQFERQLLALALARAARQASGADKGATRYVLAVWLPEDGTEFTSTDFQRLSVEAGLLGIEVRTVRDAHDLVALIVSIESGMDQWEDFERAAKEAGNQDDNQQ